MKLVRRLILLLITIVILIVGYAYFIEPNQLIVKNEKFYSDKIEKPIKIVVFSDTHFGRIYAPNNFEKIVAKINEQNADLVLFAGDFFDVYAKDQDILNIDYFKSQLNNIKATIGKYAVWGNRDCGGGVVRFYENMMEEGGFQVLKNQSLLLDEINLELSGLDDYLLGTPNLDLPIKDKNLFQLLLFHEPDLLEEINSTSFDLALAGHSHGGQIALPLITEKILPFGARKYVKGFYEKDDLSLFVTSGIGMTKIPFRFLNLPEIISIELLPSKTK